MRKIYLDHAASTPVHPEVVKVMMSVMQENFGNASSVHAFGRAAKRLVNEARDRLSAALGCKSEELVFTAGGTEGDNLAIFGTVFSRQDQGRHIITSAIEHHAVLHSCRQLEKLGFDVTYLPVDETGRVSTEQVIEAVRPDTVLVSIMYGNNEVGTLQPIKEIGNALRSLDREIVFHVDAVQALGAVPIRCHEMPVDLMTFSSHKINGPQGVGALYIRKNLKIEPMLHGGLQEKKRRAGTENMAGIVGFAKAAELVVSGLQQRREHDLRLRAELIAGLEQNVGKDHFHVNGSLQECLAHIVNISFPAMQTETMLMNLDLEGIAVASGSACTSGSLEPSHVLEAMKLPQDILRSAIRFSFGLGNTSEEIAYTTEKIGTILKRVRN